MGTCSAAAPSRRSTSLVADQSRGTHGRGAVDDIHPVDRVGGRVPRLEKRIGRSAGVPSTRAAREGPPFGRLSRVRALDHVETAPPPSRDGPLHAVVSGAAYVIRGQTNPLPPRLSALVAQKMSFAPSWMLRGRLRVLVTLPKSALLGSRFGAVNQTKFVALYTSM